MWWSLTLFNLAGLAVQISAHGRLMDPPGRNSMWRFGYVNPVNYNDNELFCGGVAKQFQTNGGKCGICGDSYEEPSPQSHETGGKFGNRIISKTYVMGSIINIEIDKIERLSGFSLSAKVWCFSLSAKVWCC